jgi:IS1 family transposase
MSMNKLPRSKRVEIITLLVEGMSLRAVTRATGASINTVTKLLVTAGMACSDYQHEKMQNLHCRRIQVDEIWAFTYCKDKNLDTAKAAPDQAGSIWTWVAIDADTKLVPTWMIGDRDGATAHYFIKSLAGRIANRIQLTSDGHRPYLTAVETHFGGDIDYAVLVKHYGPSGDSADPSRRYSPAECIAVQPMARTGNPDPKHISTSFVERQNLTMRMSIRRFTRLTNAFSKKAENHAWAVALHFMHYNFCRIHKTLKCTPAMKAGVTPHLWEIVDLVRMIEDWEAK